MKMAEDSDPNCIVNIDGSLTRVSPFLEDSGVSNNFFAVENFCEIQVPVNNAMTRQSRVNDFSEPDSTFNMVAINKQCIPADEQDEELKQLGVCAYDQTQFETEVMDQVDQAMKQQEEKHRKMRIEKELKSVEGDIRNVKKRLDELDKMFAFTPSTEQLMNIAGKKDVLSLKKEHDMKVKHMKKLEAKRRALNACVTGNKEDLNDSTLIGQGDSDVDEVTSYHLQEAFAPEESEEDRLIRTGQMTPFGTVTATKVHPQVSQNVTASDSSLTAFDRYLLDQVRQQERKRNMAKTRPRQQGQCTPTDSAKRQDVSDSRPSQLPLTRKPVIQPKKKIQLGTKHALGAALKPRKKKFTPNFTSDNEMSDFENGDVSDDDNGHPDDDYVPEQLPSDDSDDYNEDTGVESKNRSKKKTTTQKEAQTCGLKKSPSKKNRRVVDDGLREAYLKRIKLYRKEKLLEKHKKILESEDGIVDSDDEDCVEFDGGFKVPCVLWNRLYRYQQTGVRWLWELHQQNCGGIVGDEMGLGKTIQIIVFLAGLETSGIQTVGDSYQGLGPVLLVCPTTVMHQWVKEFHSWYPLFCVAILHESGSYVGNKENLIATVGRRKGILVTSYVGLVHHQKCLLRHDWHYVILDEGHKIRNPDAQATLVAKQVRTAHRLILSGSPIQNNLKELWSLFDFVYPGKLGTLPIFMQQFSVPIVQGGYANASQVQVKTAYKCATVLRDTIKPYLLRRMKADVKMSINLPNKNEQVLFCKLTDDQVQLYKDYIASPEVNSILNARLQVFVGLVHLRKICNHPDLYTGGPKVFKDSDVAALADDMHYGYYKRSGKMIVVDALLRLWCKQGHRVLLFTQSRQMMEILEIFVKRREYTYMKMDGSTAVSSRQPAIEKFNSDPSIFVFLLTTRVGGIGVNLTGANRIIIYDPDWNPSTDAQARERSWRIGQEKQVTIYRLLTAGTIEEKIYHRQIFKQFVTNRVLKDPRQRRFFKHNSLYELFTFTEMGTEGTETSAIFAGTGSEVKPVAPCKSSSKDRHVPWTAPAPKEIKASFSSEKIAKMKELAKKLSLQLLTNPSTSSPPKVEPPATSVATNVEDGGVMVGEMKGNEAADGCEADPTNTDPLPKHEKSKTKSKKHKKKARQKVKVDGEEIDYLVKKGNYKTPDPEEEDSAKDDYVLSKLFQKSGVYTALRHDVIVDSSDPDYMLVEGEANKVAQEAIKALRQSQRQCAAAAEGIPTWTGANGGMKSRFGVKRKMPLSNEAASRPVEDGPSASGFVAKKSTSDGNDEPAFESNVPASSSDLLAAIRQRELFSVENDPDTPSMYCIEKESELLSDIRNFIAFRAAVDGQATTDELLREYQRKLPLELTAVFKSLLSKICDFSRTTSGEGTWYLKGEFR